MTARRHALLAGLAAALAFATVSSPADELSSLDVRYANGIAAIVEDRVITVEEIKREIAPLLPELRRNSRSEEEFSRQLDQLQQEVIQSVVDRTLLVKEFDKKELRIPPSFVENEFDETLQREFEGDRARFLNYLRERGMSAIDFRRELAEQIKVGYMRQQMLKSQSVVSPVKIESFYRDNQARFMQEDAVDLRLIRLSQLTDEGPDVIEQQARQIVEQLRNGADFGALARQFSQDSRRTQDGHWGWITRSSLQPQLAEVAFNLPKGAHSDPVRIGKDIFILQVDARRFAGAQPLDEVRPEIERILQQQMLREGQERMLQRLRGRYYIRYF